MADQTSVSLLKNVNTIKDENKKIWEKTNGSVKEEEEFLDVGADAAVLFPKELDNISCMALDIGGSLIKLVYFSRHEQSSSIDDETTRLPDERSQSVYGGRLHFRMFENKDINDCLDFIQSKQHHGRGANPQGWGSEAHKDGNAIIKVSGAGSIRFADLLKERLGIAIDAKDEADCLVTGANFLLKVFPDQAFTLKEFQKEVVHIDQNDLFPYLLVIIGSGVGITKVEGDGKYQMVDGCRISGATCLGLGMLLTKCTSFNELVELSERGNKKTLDLLVGDIYGGDGYINRMTVPASTTVAHFGKAAFGSKELGDCMREDTSQALFEMVSHNIGQISCLNALLFGTKRIIFGGSFIKDNAYVMDTISSTVRYKSRGKVEAMFLESERFVGAIGALMRRENQDL